MERALNNSLNHEELRSNFMAIFVIVMPPLALLVIILYSISSDFTGIVMLIWLCFVISALVVKTYWIKVITRPVRAIVRDDSVIFEYRGSRKLHCVRWEDVRHLSMDPGDPSVIFGLNSRGGVLVDGRSRQYRLRFEVAEAVRGAYYDSMGHEPPIEEGRR